MKKFNIRVTESASVTYTIEANNAEQAANLFEYWLSINDGIVHDDLNRNYCGFDTDEPQEAPESATLDSDYSDLMDAVWEELDFQITHAMNDLELNPTETAIRKIGQRVLEDTDFEHTGKFNDCDVKIAIRNYINELMNK